MIEKKEYKCKKIESFLSLEKFLSYINKKQYDIISILKESNEYIVIYKREEVVM